MFHLVIDATMESVNLLALPIPLLKMVIRELDLSHCMILKHVSRQLDSIVMEYFYEKGWWLNGTPSVTALQACESPSVLR